MEQQQPTTVPGPDLFVEAAWLHAREMAAEKGCVVDVMVLGRYADEELMFVFPSGQDRAAFGRACAAEAQSFGADIAIMVTEGVLSFTGRGETEVALVFVRERTATITRLQYAAIARVDGSCLLGLVNSVLQPQANEFTDIVFSLTGAVH